MTILYVHKRRCPAHAWDWLCAKAGVYDNRPVILVIEGSDVHLGLMERLYS